MKIHYYTTVAWLRSCFCLMLLGFSTLSFAQSEGDEGKDEAVSQSIFEIFDGKSEGFIPVPIIYYTPDTRWAAGAFGVYYFKLKNEAGEDTRLSFVKLLADYTQNRQVDVWGSWNVFLKDEAYLLRGETRYRNFPDRYYGIGNQTPESNREAISYNFVDFTLMGLKRIYPFTYLGPDLRFTNYFNVEMQDDGLLAQSGVPGKDGGNNVGLGVVALYDSRDYIVNATKGHFAELASYVYRPAWLSDFSYTNIKGSYATYWQFKPNHILAYHAVMNLNFGDAPFTNLARVGDESILRGYAANRYRDNHMIANQVEYRFPIYWRFGGVAFAGFGDVFGPDSEAQWSTLKYSYGTGFRFALNKAERMNFRFDYAWGRETSSFYIMVTEAF